MNDDTGPTLLIPHGGGPWTLKRPAFGVKAYAPMIGDEITLAIAGAFHRPGRTVETIASPSIGDFPCTLLPERRAA